MIDNFKLNLKSNSWIIYILIFASNINYISMDIHLPVQSQMASDLGATAFEIQSIFIISFLMMTFLPMVWGPLCDTIGRRRVILLSMKIFLIGQFLSVFAPTFEWLITFRIVQGFGGGALYAGALTVICDLHQNKDRARYIALFEMCGPIFWTIAPVLGAYISCYLGWRSNFLILAMLGGVAYILITLFVPETLKEKKPFKLNRAQGHLKTLFKDYKFLMYLFVLGFVDGGWLIFIVSAPFLYVEKFGLTPHEYAYYQVIPVICYFLGMAIYRKLVAKYSVRHLVTIGMWGYAPYSLSILGLIIKPEFLTANTLLVIMAISAVPIGLVNPGTSLLAINHAPPSATGTTTSLIHTGTNLIGGISMVITSYFFREDGLSMLIGIFIATLGVITAWTLSTKMKGASSK